MENYEIVLLCVLFLWVGACTVGLIYESRMDKNIILSHETADKICLDLTNESGVVAKDGGDFYGEEKPIKKGELYCQIPSYDETHLIKVGK